MKRTVSLIVALLLGGCAQLEVAVDILEPTRVQMVTADARSCSEYVSYVQESQQDVESAVGALEREHEKAFLDLADVYDKLASAAKDDTDQANDNKAAKGLRDGFARNSDPSKQGAFITDYDNYVASLEKSDLNVREIASGTSWQCGKPLPSDLRAALLIRKTTDEQKRAYFRESINAAVKAAKTKLDEKGQTLPSATQTQIETANRYNDTPIGGPTLAASDYAYAVASAAGDQWRTDFNYAFGRGTFGNTDVIVKLGSQADFTIKGLLFDPSAVAATAGKAMTQSVLLAARVAGAPVSGSSLQSGTAKTGQLLVGNTSTDAGQKILERNARLNAWRGAVRDIAQTVLSEQADINGNDKERAAAGAAIGAVVSSHTDTLKLTGIN